MNEAQAIRRNHNARLLNELKEMIPKLNRAQAKLKKDREDFKSKYGYDPLRGVA